MFLQIKTDSTLNLANSVSIYLYLVVGGAAVGVDDAAGVDAVDVGDAAVDVGEIVVVVAFDADVASEHASSFVVASYAVVAAAAAAAAAAAVGGGGDVVAVVSVRLLSFYFGESKNSWTFWI